ncbi:Endoglucanase precursor [compost metagenome]
MYVDNVKVYTYEQLTDQVIVTPETIQLLLGETIALAVQITPLDAVNNLIVWVSSDDRIASVDTNGLVKALSAGTAHIVVRTIDNSERAESVITVVSPVPEEEEDSSAPQTTTNKPQHKDDDISIFVNSEKKANALVKMDDTTKELRISAESLNRLTMQNVDRFDISRGDINLSFDMKTLLSIISKMGTKDGSNAEIMLKIDTLTSDETDRLKRTPAFSPIDGKQTQILAGDMYQVEMAVVSGEVEQAIHAFEQPVVVTLPYRDGVNTDLLGVYYHQEATGNWEYVGGKVNKEHKQIQVQWSHFSIYTIMAYDLSFTDVPTDHWAYEALKIAAAQHVIDGRDDGSFAPLDITSRSQFAAMIARSLHLKGSGQIYFDDVPQDAWYAQAVSSAVEAGLISGRTPQLFAPEEPITREEMAVILVRAAGKQGYNGVQGEKIYQDEQQISEWALPYVRTAAQIGLMKGASGGLFHPTQSATRAEAVKALVNFMQYNLIDK